MLYTALQILDRTYKFKTGTQEGEINGLKKVNIFVGQNNSGKSRFMRSLLSKNIGIRSDNILDLNLWNIYSLSLYELADTMYRIHNESDFNVIKGFISNKSKNFLVPEYGTDIGILKNAFQNIESIVNGFNGPGMRYSHKEEFFRKYQEIRVNFPSDYFEVSLPEEIKKVYVPLLRGLKNPIIKSTTDDIYAKRTFFDYFYDGVNIINEKFDNQQLEAECRDKKFVIFSGLTLYEDIKRMLLGNHEQRELVRDFEIFLSQSFFNNVKITLTPHIDDDVLYIKIGKGNDYPIYDLGDGIQSIIISTFPLFKYKDENVLFFIEEPEIGIHPGMQRILLETFTKGVDGQEGSHQIFFTTHSNHLLDIALDEDISNEIGIYQFRDYGDEKYITNISQNKEILDLLGVRNSSVFLTNCIIWVEGISDRIYIKKWLSLYFQKKGKIQFEEDKHFSILEYGGGNVVHFNFSEEDTEDNINVQGINKNNFIIADNDGYPWRGSINPSDPEKAKRLKFLYKELGADNFFCDLREIENGLGEIWLKRFIDSCNFIKKRISVNYRTTSIDWNMSMGEILRKHFLKKDGRKKLKYFDDQDHIEVCSYSKVQVAESINNMDDLKFDDLPKITQNLVKKLYEFIKTNNSN